MRTLIVGSSVAGVRTARAMRSRGSDDEVLVLGAEQDLPYDRPCLSKTVLAGEMSRGENVLLSAQGARELRVELVLGRAARSLDLSAQVVHTDGGAFSFDRLVVATGVEARRLPWSDLPGVHVLRTASDCTALSAAFDEGGLVVVVGGGFIGCEVAATARRLGLEVVLVEPRETLLPVAGPELGSLVGGLHAAHGVDLRLGLGVDAVATTKDGLEMRLSDGQVVMAQSVVLGIGATPNVGWLEGSGLDVTDGVACDSWGRAKIAGRNGAVLDHVFAVGDIARWDDPRGGGGQRFEHWTNAGEQAQTVARILAGERPLQDQEAELGLPPHVPNSYVWSDQYDWTVHLVGAREAAVDIIALRPAEAGQIALLGGDASGALTFAAVVSWPRALLAVRRGITSGALVGDIVGQLAPPVRAPNGAGV